MKHVVLWIARDVQNRQAGMPLPYQPPEGATIGLWHHNVGNDQTKARGSPLENDEGLAGACYLHCRITRVCEDPPDDDPGEFLVVYD